jgi:hypothetical protein
MKEEHLDKHYFYYKDSDYGKRKFMLDENRMMTKSEKINQYKWVMIKVWIIIGLIAGLSGLTWVLSAEWGI